MSTHLMTYLNYIATWDGESGENILNIIQEHDLFVNLGDFDSDTAIDTEFNTLNDLATQLHDNTTAVDAIHILADAAAVPAIWSFGLSMAVFVALQAAEILMKSTISAKSTALNHKLTYIDTDISAQVNEDVNEYVMQYKANNNLIAWKALQGLDTTVCRLLLMQFLAEVQLHQGFLDSSGFKKYAQSARILANSVKINKVYKALDELNFSAKNDDDVKRLMRTIAGLDFPAGPLKFVQTAVIGVMYRKLGIANDTIKKCTKAAGLKIEEAGSSAFGMMDAVGTFATAVAVILSVVDVVGQVIGIVDVVEQSKTLCDKLNGPIRQSYKDYFNGIRTASQKYRAAIAPKAAT